jgi:hypothetical protein
MTPEQRLREVASILAVGVLRLRDRAALPPADKEENAAESPAAGLEVPDETVLSVHTG